MAITMEKIDDQESWAIFDAAAHRLLQIDGETFATRWDRGEYADDADTNVMKVAMLRPSGR